MTIRTTLASALALAAVAGLAAPADAQVYISPNGGIGISGSYYNPIAGTSNSYYYSPSTGLSTYGTPGTSYVTPSAYNYTTPTNGWYQTGYSYPATSYTYPNSGYTTYSYPGYGTTISTYPSYGYTGTSYYPTYTGMSYYPGYNTGYYNNSAFSTPYNTYTTVRRWFRR
jgi:hypothetical protein